MRLLAEIKFVLVVERPVVPVVSLECTGCFIDWPINRFVWLLLTVVEERTLAFDAVFYM